MRQANEFLKLEVAKLYIKGKTQKAIALRFEMTEKTIGIWLKEIKAKLAENQKNIDLLNQQLQQLLNSKTAKPADIKNLIVSISLLEKKGINKLIN